MNPEEHSTMSNGLPLSSSLRTPLIAPEIPEWLADLTARLKQDPWGPARAQVLRLPASAIAPLVHAWRALENGSPWTSFALIDTLAEMRSKTLRCVSLADLGLSVRAAQHFAQDISCLPLFVKLRDDRQDPDILESVMPRNLHLCLCSALI